jgi:hypothetical protein
VADGSRGRLLGAGATDPVAWTLATVVGVFGGKVLGDPARGGGCSPPCASSCASPCRSGSATAGPRGSTERSRRRSRRCWRRSSSPAPWPTDARWSRTAARRHRTGAAVAVAGGPLLLVVVAAAGTAALRALSA